MTLSNNSYSNVCFCHHCMCFKFLCNNVPANNCSHISVSYYRHCHILKKSMWRNSKWREVCCTLVTWLWINFSLHIKFICGVCDGDYFLVWGHKFKSVELKLRFAYRRTVLLSSALYQPFSYRQIPHKYCLPMLGIYLSNLPNSRWRAII